MFKQTEISSLVRLTVLLVGIVAAVFSVWACVDTQMLFAAFGAIALFFVTCPFLQIKKYDLFSPWSFVILAIGVLCTPQAICMSFMWPEAEPIERMMLLGKEPEYFLYPAGVFLLGLVCLTYGYFGLTNRKPKHLVVQRRYNERNLWIVLSATIAVSLLSTLFFVRYTGGFESGRISDKRTNLKTIDVQAGDTQQHGHLRQVSKLGSVAFLILYSYFLVKYKRLTMAQIAFLGFVFVIAVAVPFYSSSRSQVCWIVLNTLGVNYYLGRGNFIAKVAVVGAIGLVLFTAMSGLRNTDTSAAIEDTSSLEIFEKLILNRNGPGLSKTAHIINHVPDPLQFQYGSTFAEWLIAPVPRAIYPTKPMIGRGVTIGRTIYGMKLSGVPPGYIAELYWNFYIPGIIFGMFSLGVLLERLHSIFRNATILPEIAVPIYLFAVMPIAFSVLGNSLGYGTMMRLVDFFTITGIIFLASTRTQAFEQSSP